MSKERTSSVVQLHHRWGLCSLQAVAQLCWQDAHRTSKVHVEYFCEGLVLGHPVHPRSVWFGTLPRDKRGQSWDKMIGTKKDSALINFNFCQLIVLPGSHPSQHQLRLDLRWRPQSQLHCCAATLGRSSRESCRNIHRFSLENTSSWDN